MGYGVEISFADGRAMALLLQVALWLTFVLILALQVLQWRAALNYVEERHIDYPGFHDALGEADAACVTSCRARKMS